MQTILLVEDDYELNESITYMLRQEQYEVSLRIFHQRGEGKISRAGAGSYLVGRKSS